MSFVKNERISKSRSYGSAGLRFNQLSIRSKLMIALIVTSVLPLAIFTYWSVDRIRNALRAEIGQSYQVLSREKALEVAAVLEQRISETAALAAEPHVVDFMVRANEARAGWTESDIRDDIARIDKEWIAAKGDTEIARYILANELSSFFSAYKNRHPLEYGEIFATDAIGATAAMTATLTDYYQADEGWWRQSFAASKGAIYLDDRGYDLSVKSNVLGVVAPIRKDNVAIGVLKINFRMTSIPAIINNPHDGGGFIVSLTRSRGNLVASSLTDPPENVSKEKIDVMLGNESTGWMLNEVGPDRIITGFARVSPSRPIYSRIVGPEAFKGVTGEGWGETTWHVFVDRPAEIALSPLATLTEAFIVFAILLLIALPFLAIALTKFLLNPLNLLQQGAEAIAAGNFDYQINMKTRDEIGRVADSFNAMTARLKETTERLRTIIDYAPMDIFLKDLEGRYLMVNRTFADRFQIKGKDQFLGKTDFDFFSDEASKACAKMEREIIDNSQVLTKEEDVSLSFGENTYTFLTTKFPIFNVQGDIVSIGTISLDNSERKKAEAARRESDKRFRSAFESAGHGIALVAPDGHWLEVNDALCDIVGYDRDELLDIDFQTITHPDDLDIDMANVQRTLAGEIPGYQMEKRYFHKDGREVPVILSVGLVRDDSNAPLYFVSQIVDISSHKQAEKLLKKLSRAVEQNTSAIVITDTDGIIEYVNPTFTEITGYNSDEAIGRKTSLVRSGETEEAVYEELWQTILSGKNWHGELTNRRKDGGLYRSELRALPVIDEAGVVVNFVGISDDITEHKKTEQQLQQAQKMEAVGNLTGGIAHDFNNILGIVLGNLQLMQRAAKGNEKIQKLSSTAIEATLRGADLTKRLLAFSRRQELDPTVLDVNALLTGMNVMLRRTLGEHIEVDMMLAYDLWRTKADAAQLESSILNLAINARDSMPRGGKLIIETSNEQLDESYLERHPYAKTGPHVCLSVSDTGAGIPDDIKDKIFEPFFTTKDVGKGSGLGLSMVFGFVKQSGGHINVYSEVGHGTRFRIYLPSTDESGGKLIAETDKTIDLPGGDETILLVEDEEAFLQTAALLLEDLGYTVITKQNGPDALKLIVSSSTIDLLFTDMVMPGGMNGHQLAEKAQEHRPGLRVLLTSGYSRDAFTRGRNYPLLSKPYTAEALAQAIRKTLDDKTGIERK